MKLVRIISQTVDRLRHSSILDELHGSMVTVVGMLATGSMAIEGTGLSTGTRATDIAVRTACVHNVSAAGGHWLYTPKFGDFDHFQRWRCTT